MLNTNYDSLVYRYLGEVDNPDDMLRNFATLQDVKKCKGKANWFLSSNGKFFTCGDCATDSLLESGKVVGWKFRFEEEREKKYQSLSITDKIGFRVLLQGITERQAKEIVCNEMRISCI